mgnify:CR=1 FL=1
MNESQPGIRAGFSNKETWGNSQSVEQVIDILEAIAHNSKVTKGVGR